MERFKLEVFLDGSQGLDGLKFEDGDVLVRFDDRDFLLLHSRILKEQSTFFSALLDRRWNTPHLVKVRANMSYSPLRAGLLLTMVLCRMRTISTMPSGF
jgi:hypothetical protein